MVKVTRSVFSRNVMEEMEKPIEDIISHIKRVDFNNQYPHTPQGKDAELLKLLRFFKVNPEANWLIDRKNSDWKRIDVSSETESVKLVHMLLCKTVQFKGRHEDGRDYVLGGILPIVYKYVTSLKSLTNYRSVMNIEAGCNNMTQLLESLNQHRDGLAHISGLKAALLDFSSCQLELENLSQTTKNKGDSAQDKTELGDRLQKYCTQVLIQIKKMYEGKPKYLEILHQYFEVTKLQYKTNKKSVRFVERRTMSEDESNKHRILNLLLVTYKEAKARYINNDSPEGMASIVQFFFKNPDNLRGVFESTFEGLFDKSNT
jgi:hypothetical protein